MAKLLLLFTVVPLLELYLLLLVGDLLGFWPTVWLVMVTGAVGAWLAKREGLRVWQKWQEALAAGKMPEEGVLGGLLVLVGGVLLVTPGVLTDITGLLLLIPPSRRAIAHLVRSRMETQLRTGSVQVISFGHPGSIARPPMGAPSRSRHPANTGGVIDGGVIDVEGEVVEVDVHGAGSLGKD